MTTKKDFKFYIDELKSEECICGRPKKKKKSFCYQCFTSLPRNMQQDLYRHILEGYEEAYEAAVEWLTG